MGSWRKPKTPPKPPPVRTVAFGVTSHGQPVPNADVTVDGWPTDWTDLTNADGYIAFHGVPVVFQISHVWVTANGYQPFEMHLDIPPYNHQFNIELTSLVPALQPVHIEQGRYLAVDHWIVPRFMSCFLAIWLFQTGQLYELRRQLQRAKDARCNGIRIFGMLDWPAVKFSPRDETYWTALTTVVDEAATYGLYVSWCFFCDAQRIVPNTDERRNWADAAGSFLTSHSTVFFRLANEARKNGWGEADDPELLALARHVKAVSPQTIVSVSDPIDPDRKEDVAQYNERQRRIATVADHLVVHPSRMDDHAEWARWVNHLKNLSDTQALIEKQTWADEPMGMASQRIEGRRDNRATAHIAAQLVGAMVGGYTVMHRSDEDDATPGLMEGAIAADIPGSPDYKFYNAGTPGAPVGAFNGYDKIRCMWNGQHGYAVGHGWQMGNVEFHGHPDTVLHLERDGEGRNTSEKGIVTLWKIAA